MSLRMGALFLPLLLVAFAIVSDRAAAQGCPPGTRPATESDFPNMPQALRTVGTCWNPSDQNVGQAVGEAMAFLQQHTSGNPNVSCLNAEFAQRLARLMKETPGGVPKITGQEGAYRRPEAQIAAQRSGASQVGPCASYHQYGLAVDFNSSNTQTQRWLRENASRFGLSPVTNANPTTGCTPRGFCDYGHIQISGQLPPREQCGLCANTQGYNYPPSPPSGGAPLGFGNQFRSAFGMQPTLPPQPTLPTQPYTQQQPLLNAFNQTPQSQVQPSGVSGQITTTNTNTNTNQNTNTSSSSATSVADQLLQLAFGTSSAPGSGTNATSVPIVITGANSGSIASTQQTGMTNPELQNTGSLQPVGQQTFVSNDLRTQQPIATQTYNSRLQETLGTLRTALTLLLQYLKPFGGFQRQVIMYE